MTHHAALLAAHSLFLWMFLAASPLEQLADEAPAALRAQAFSFAASWRHGMAGNSPLYMPGFFAVAVATWFWIGSRQLWPALAQAAAVMGLGLLVAWIAVQAGGDHVVRAFALTTDASLPGPTPRPGWGSIVSGLYTLATWSVFVAGCRRALATRSWRPLAPVPPLTAVLMAIRPWTADDFTRDWLHRSLEGNTVAIASLLAIPAIAAVLARQGLRDHVTP